MPKIFIDVQAKAGNADKLFDDVVHSAERAAQRMEAAFTEAFNRAGQKIDARLKASVDPHLNSLQRGISMGGALADVLLQGRKGNIASAALGSAGVAVQLRQTYNEKGSITRGDVAEAVFEQGIAQFGVRLIATAIRDGFSDGTVKAKIREAFQVGARAAAEVQNFFRAPTRRETAHLAEAAASQASADVIKRLGIGSLNDRGIERLARLQQQRARPLIFPPISLSGDPTFPRLPPEEVSRSAALAATLSTSRFHMRAQRAFFPYSDDSLVRNALIRGATAANARIVGLLPSRGILRDLGDELRGFVRDLYVRLSEGVVKPLVSAGQAIKQTVARGLPTDVARGLSAGRIADRIGEAQIAGRGLFALGNRGIAYRRAAIEASLELAGGVGLSAELDDKMRNHPDAERTTEAVASISAQNIAQRISKILDDVASQQARGFKSPALIGSAVLRGSVLDEMPLGDKTLARLGLQFNRNDAALGAGTAGELVHRSSTLEKAIGLPGEVINSLRESVKSLAEAVSEAFAKISSGAKGATGRLAELLAQSKAAKQAAEAWKLFTTTLHGALILLGGGAAVLRGIAYLEQYARKVKEVAASGPLGQIGKAAAKAVKVTSGVDGGIVAPIAAGAREALAKAAEIIEPLSKAGAVALRFGSGLLTVGRVLTGLWATGLYLAAEATAKFVSSTFNASEALIELRKQYGLGTNFLIQYQDAAKAANVDFGKLAELQRALGTHFREAAQGSPTGKSLLESLGLGSGGNFADAAKNADEQFGRVLRQIRDAPTEIERWSIATAAFGDNAKEAVALAEKLTDEVKTGPSPEAIAAVAGLKDAWRALKQELKDFLNEDPFKGLEEAFGHLMMSLKEGILIGLDNVVERLRAIGRAVPTEDVEKAARAASIPKGIALPFGDAVTSALGLEGLNALQNVQRGVPAEIAARAKDLATSPTPKLNPEQAQAAAKELAELTRSSLTETQRIQQDAAAKVARLSALIKQDAEAAGKTADEAQIQSMAKQVYAEAQAKIDALNKGKSGTDYDKEADSIVQAFQREGQSTQELTNYQKALYDIKNKIYKLDYDNAAAFAAQKQRILSAAIAADVRQSTEEYHKSIQKIHEEIDRDNAERQQKGTELLKTALQGAEGPAPNHYTEAFRNLDSAGITDQFTRQQVLNAAARQDQIEGLKELRAQVDQTESDATSATAAYTKSMIEQAEAIKDSLDPERAYQREIDKTVQLQRAGLLTYNEMIDKLRQLKDQFDQGGKSADDMSEFFKQAARNMETALAGGLFDAMQGRIHKIGQVFKETIDRMVANALAAQLADKLFGGKFGKTGQVSDIGGWLGKLFGLGSTGGAQDAAVGAGGGWGYGTFDQQTAFHTGGIIGVESPALRTIANSVFSTAKRFHSGGLVGDEMPIIAKRGEGVFTRQQMANLAPVGSGATVNNYFTVPAPTDTRTQQQVARQAGVAVQRAMMRNG